MSKVVLFETHLEPSLDADDNEAEITVGTMELAPGLTVAAWIAASDGALVVQIDTPADGPESDQHERVRVHLNDSTAGRRWGP